MRALFPLLPVVSVPKQALPLYRDSAWDFERDQPVFSAGEPVMVEGAEAVKVWCYHALRAARYHNPAQSDDYGSELERLVGRGYDQDAKQAEAMRYITEALTASPYVEQVSVSQIVFDGGTLSGAVSIETIYGEVHLRV